MEPNVKKNEPFHWFEIEQFLLEELDPGRSMELRNRMATDPAFASRIDKLRSTLPQGPYKELPAEWQHHVEVAQAKRINSWWKPLAIAAVLAIALIPIAIFNATRTMPENKLMSRGSIGLEIQVNQQVLSGASPKYSVHVGDTIYIRYRSPSPLRIHCKVQDDGGSWQTLLNDVNAAPSSDFRILSQGIIVEKGWKEELLRIQATSVDNAADSLSKTWRLSLQPEQ